MEVQEAEQERVRRIPTDNLTAYDAWLRGVEYIHRFTKEADEQARQLFEQAIALDPQYADAYAWLGYYYINEETVARTPGCFHPARASCKV